MNYLDYWKLNDKPFESTRNPKFFYASENHGEALERLLYIINDRNMNIGLLTGEIGSGKTITKTILEHQLLRNNFEVVSIENSNFPFHSILIEIVSQLLSRKIDSSQNDEYTLINLLKDRLVNIVIENNRHLVILMDEAQQQSKDSLDKLKNLTNICAENENYLTIILIGQPELKPLIRALPQIDQRVSLRYHLRYLPEHEVEGYIKHRLKIAGYPFETLFTGEALDLIYMGTKGIPREINRTCRLALDNSFALGLDRIPGKVIEAILKDFNLQSSTSNDLVSFDQTEKRISAKKQRIIPKKASYYLETTKRKVLVLTDPLTMDKKILQVLTDVMGYLVSFGKKNKMNFKNTDSADLIIIFIDFKNKEDVSIYHEFISSTKKMGPRLFIFDVETSRKLKEKMKKIDVGILYEMHLFMPFHQSELIQKVTNLSKK